MSVCTALENPAYAPAMRLISEISREQQARVVTTYFYNTDDLPPDPGAHGYVVGTKIRFYVAKSCGMPEINRLIGTIVSVPSETSFFVDIDTRSFQPYEIPEGVSPLINVCSYVVPVGEINSTLAAAVERT